MKRYSKFDRDSAPDTQSFTITRSGTKFRVSTTIYEDPSQFMFEILEVHPYDEADYAWAKKVSPTSFNIYKDGRRISSLPVPDFDDEIYEDVIEYYNECLDIAYLALIEANKDVKPQMSYN